MINRLKALLRRVLGVGAPPPAPPPPSRPSAQRVVESGIRIEYQGAAAQQPARAPARVSWRKEGPRMPRLSLENWKRRTSPRQRFLVAVAALAIIAEAVVFANWLFTTRRLPAATFGVWSTSATGYADRLFELRARRLAFLTRDPAQPVQAFTIRRVRSKVLDNGVRYSVEYEGAGGVAEFRFVLITEPDLEIRFVNQPHMVWQRVSRTQTFMPEIF